ncbi:MAG: glycoside hydrolase family 3 C-terminal domain-containing protein [Clostridia bacterium]|nr:glycoside hydrolase family 3 C-terminal domain-containing protein [Clostridia bacterium]
MKAFPKWQRIRYSPATTLGEDGRRVTACDKHIALSREAACEGMVLLKNDENLLPFAKGTKLALFGKGTVDYVKGGGGSGDVTVSYTRCLLKGLCIKQNEGKVELFAPLNDYYTAYMQEQYAQGQEPGRCPEAAVPAELLEQARAFTDTAVITLCRFSGEGWDRTGKPYDGDFYLSHEEEAMVQAVQATFPRIVVVLNTGGMMDTVWFKDNSKIQSALLAWQAGIEGGLATADILCGDVCPSGRLTDTFAVNFAAYPSSDTFNESEDYVTYNEDIFVGYRYFETIPGAAEKVCYPFGYGLSYTSFEITGAAAKVEADQITVTAKVTNTGAVAGKHVVQVYCQAPQGKLGKAARVLVGFAKTALLQAGQSQDVTITFVPYAFASYDDIGAVSKSAWVLEKGEYLFHVGSSVRDCVQLAETYTLKDDVVLEQLTARCQPRQLTWRLLADGTHGEVENLPALPKPDVDDPAVPKGPPVEMKFNAMRDQKAEYTLGDVAAGKITLDEFMATLTVEQMVYMLGGQPNRGVANTWGFGGLDSHGIPNVMTADGPAGLRIQPQCGVNTTAFPCATLLSCSWNEEIVERIGVAAALEVKENGIGSWLAPAMNIHRNPLCGRNFEYYSEDPLVAGRMATAMVKGVQSQGVATSVKHFACNNKEVNRMDSDSRLSERALREIYLKGFEIAVKEAQPITLMTSYNIINGIRASENKDLLTHILRGEWGFKGLVTTDWWTHGLHYKEIAAGNDIKMPTGNPEHTLQMILEGKLDPECVRTSARRLMEAILRLD